MSKVEAFKEIHQGRYKTYKYNGSQGLQKQAANISAWLWEFLSTLIFDHFIRLSIPVKSVKSARVIKWTGCIINYVDSKEHILTHRIEDQAALTSCLTFYVSRSIRAYTEMV